MVFPALRFPSPLEEVSEDFLSRSGITLHLKRDDLIHEDLPGNKWRKLKYNLATARAEGATTLLTFGGAYSHHIRAVAAAGYYFDFATIGIIRGEEHLPLNPTLSYASEHGMKLSHLDRTSYRNKTDASVISSLTSTFGDFYLIPEGGGNAEGVRGAAEVVDELPLDFDYVCCSCGTGGTLAGIASGLGNTKTAIGFAALKGASGLDDDVSHFQSTAFGAPTNNWSIEHGYAFGGYAKRTDTLNSFIDRFHRRHNVRLDWVYEAKMMYGLYDLIDRGTVSRGTTIVALIAG